MSLIKKCDRMCCKTLISDKHVFNCVSLPYFTLLCNLKMNIIVFISFILCSNLSWNCSLKNVLIFCSWNIHKYSWKIININPLAFISVCRQTENPHEWNMNSYSKTCQKIEIWWNWYLSYHKTSLVLVMYSEHQCKITSNKWKQIHKGIEQNDIENMCRVLNPFQPELMWVHRKNKFHANCV